MFRISPEHVLPASAPTDTFAILGTRDSGKTYFAGKLVETLHDGGVQVVVVDPVGTWYGLRLAADGRGKGLDIPVFGGLHGDVPLEPLAGELVAGLVAERRMSMVLDVSDFTYGQQHRFVRDFARQLFRLKKGNRSPLHLVWEEAHEFFPQQPGPDSAEMLGATLRLVKVGRNYGIGDTLASQRTPEVNKGALWLTKRVYTGKLQGPTDRKVIAAWVSSQGIDESMLAELPRLKQGNLIAWGEGGGVIVRCSPKRTFDSSKTPDGETETHVAKLPPVDLEEIRAAMASAIEEAKANDPKALRAEIARLTVQGRDGAGKGANDGEAQRARLAENAYWRGQLAQKDLALEETRRQARERAADLERAIEPLAMLIDRHRKTTLGSGAIGAQPGIIVREGPVTPSGPLKIAVRRPIPTLTMTATLAKPEVWTMEEEALYQKIVERLKREAPQLLKLLSVKSELLVEVKLKKIEIDGDTLKGRLAALIAHGFFDGKPAPGPSVLKELTRLGGNPASDGKNYMAVLKNLAESGFLTVEADGFQVVEGMKINIVEG